jgi:hypothetical protein
MPPETDIPSGDDRPAAGLAGQFLHQRAAFRSPRPGGRIDELDALDSAGDGSDGRDALPADNFEEDDAG